MKKKTPPIITTLILTLITLIFWVGFEVYHSYTTKAPPPVPEEIIKPLDPTLDKEVLEEVESRAWNQ